MCADIQLALSSMMMSPIERYVFSTPVASAKIGVNMKYELKDLATGKVAELNALSGTLGPDSLDISQLIRDFGVYSYDPGFMATASTESKITYIDGDAGVLLYRGYPVEQLAAQSSFLEVANLLIYGSLPTNAQLRARSPANGGPFGRRAHCDCCAFDRPGRRPTELASASSPTACSKSPRAAERISSDNVPSADMTARDSTSAPTICAYSAIAR